MTHDFHSLVKRWPMFLAALRIIFAFIMDVVKFTCVLFIVLCSYIMDAVLSVDWHKVYTNVNDARVQVSKQFVYAY